MSISIRYQIVGLVGAILIGAMSIYVYLATNLVTNDKLASIYDMNSLLAGTLSEEVKSSVGTLVDKLLYFGAEHAAAKGEATELADRRARTLFSTNNDILSIEVWLREGQGPLARAWRFVDADRLSSLNLSVQDLDEARKQTPVAMEVLAAERVLLQNASLAPDLAVLRLSAASADGRLAVVADLRPDRFLRIFGNSELYQVYLVDARGAVLLHPDPARVISHADFSHNPVVRDAIGGKALRGAREFAGEEGEIIGSYAQVEQPRMAVVVEVPKAEALKAQALLTRRSVLFALTVISIALFASIYFSRRLTLPLRRLEEQMARLSRGEFGIEVAVNSRNEIGALAAAFNKMSRELFERERALDEKNQQLIQSEKLSAIGELSAGLAHEVKNPMVGIVGFSQLGLEAQSLEEAREYFALIESDAQRANGILQNLLEFARPQKLDLELLDPNAVVQGAVRLVSHQLQISGVHLDLSLAEDPPRILGNSNQLRQVLLNLMMNAGQAMEGCRTRRLYLRTRREGEQMVIEVRDTGVGMTEEVKRHLFRPFFTTKPKGKGTGLGLSVSASIIAHHRGKIEVESAPGEGSAFFIRLPVAPSAGEQRAATSA